jgi:hypothetical protein
MRTLTRLQEAMAERLTSWPYLQGVPVRSERRGEPATLESCRGPEVIGPSVMIYAPALLLNTVSLTPTGQTLHCEALVSVAAVWMGPHRGAAAISGPADLAVAILYRLHRWAHGLDAEHLLLAERQACVPCPSEASPLAFAGRFAKGGQERFRAQVSAYKKAHHGAYLVHFGALVDIAEPGE